MNRAIFLDRDGTLVYPRHYPTDPKDLEIYEGVGPELAKLREAGFLLIVITNQSGLARGLFDTGALSRMHESLRTRLDAESAFIDAFYYCPHHPDGVVPHLSIACDCRKPEPGMLLQAAQDHDIDLRASWLVGDILDDVEAGNRVGCRTVLIDLGTEPPPSTLQRTPEFVFPTTVEALRAIRQVETRSGDEAALYIPARWRDEVGFHGTQRQHELINAG